MFSNHQMDFGLYGGKYKIEKEIKALDNFQRAL
jgi:hypothetical protein